MVVLIQIEIALALLLGYVLYRGIIYPVFISPLSRLPAAHPTAHFSSTWISRRRNSGRESRSIYAAHQRCGSIVRLGPNEVSITSQEGLRKIYSSTFTRTEWVLAFRNYDGTPNLLSMLDSREHAIRKRMLSNVFAKSYLLDSADFSILAKAIVFGRLLPIIDKAVQVGSGVDVFEISCALAVEMMSAYQVGLENSLDFTSPGREEVRKRHIENGKKKLRNLRGAKQATKDIEDECFETILKAEESLHEYKKEHSVQEGSSPLPATAPLIFTQLSTSIPTKEGAATPRDTLCLIASELLDNIEAAKLGIGITVTYALYQLSQRLDMQSQLRQELMALAEPPRYPLHEGLSKSMLHQIDGVALLDAIVIETLRLHAPAPGPQYRAVPEGGVVIDGFFIPAGVWISASPYCLHRHAGAYPDPEEWKPERWMAAKRSENSDTQGEELQDEDPRRWFWAFGRGGRMCVGSNFSLIAIKVILAAIYANFESSVIDDEGIEQRDALPADPVGDKLVLGFLRVEPHS